MIALCKKKLKYLLTTVVFSFFLDLKAQEELPVIKVRKYECVFCKTWTRKYDPPNSKLFDVTIVNINPRGLEDSIEQHGFRASTFRHELTFFKDRTYIERLKSKKDLTINGTWEVLSEGRILLIPENGISYGKELSKVMKYEYFEVNNEDRDYIRASFEDLDGTSRSGQHSYTQFER
ncbi:MAG: hypothetical protein MRY83_07270 [Flavobacteriales bacterium]|nr:hypothetical protein [Flavobacteriales bacterium]